jgi:death-on-curing protein
VKILWLEKGDVLALHERLLAQDGGASGLRDEGLLESALAKPKNRHAYDRNNDVLALAAAYTVGIVRNHPFLDGNKRTGFLTGILFAELNGYQFQGSEESAAQCIWQLAAGEIGEEDYLAFLRANSTSKRRR